MSQLAIRDPRAVEAVNKAAREHGVKPEHIKGTSTFWRIVHARRYAAWLMRHLLGMSFPQIAYHLNKDHTSVRTMLEKLKEQS